MINVEKLPKQSLETILSNCGVIHDVDIKPAADFIRACTRLNPKDRISADQAVRHKWLRNANVGCSIASNWTYYKGKHIICGPIMKGNEVYAVKLTSGLERQSKENVVNI